MSHQRYFLLLCVLFVVEFLILAVSPHDRADWALENSLVLLFAVVMTVTYQRFPLSRVSYSAIFVFLSLHEVGAHFTYAKVPYDQFFLKHFNVSLSDVMGWERNHYDRLVHFSYGLLLAYPVRELYCRVANAKGFWGYFFPLDLVMATSMMFELFEWGAAVLFGGELGVAYLGTQGDVWDAHKDMALASLGALIAMMITIGINKGIQKDFYTEWKASFLIKNNKPLGEDEIARLIELKKLN